MCYNLIWNVRDSIGGVRMKKRLVTVEAVYTHTHTDALLKNEVCFLACKVFVASVVFCAQNLIRDG